MRIAVISDSKTSVDRENVEYFTSSAYVDINTVLKFDMAVLLSPYSERALVCWGCHPHIRCCSNKNELEKEISVLESNVETERKYLIEYPDFDKLKKYAPYKSYIEQIYLESEITTRRIRKRAFGNVVIFYETVKIKIDNASSQEFESEISEAEYNELKNLSDKTKRPIVKNRYCFIYKNQFFELDIYDFWNDKAIIEIELSKANKAVELPPEIKLIKDVTDDYSYKNSQLARIDYENC